MGLGWVQRIPDSLHNRIRLIQYVAIPKTQHLKASRLHAGGPCIVMTLVISVLRTIDFNDQLSIQANKVEDDVFEGVLATKFQA